MMRFIITLLLFVCVALPVSASACDLEPWGGKGKATAEKAVKRKLSYGEPAFFGKIQILKAKEKDDGIHYKVKTLKQYGGVTRDQFDAFSSYKTSCAFKAKKGDEVLVFLPKGSSEPYEINLYDTHFFYVPNQDIESYLDAKPVPKKNDKR